MRDLPPLPATFLQSISCIPVEALAPGYIGDPCTICHGMGLHPRQPNLAEVILGDHPVKIFEFDFQIPHCLDLPKIQNPGHLSHLKILLSFTSLLFKHLNYLNYSSCI